ncbi:MAG: choice-of-anchor D domain-containing protein, partial [Candidatus Anammoximicrobium sp.]|nr:choice-of-anchor D domain-containing protein [Candidatus Anammoximicrobium sp.]
VPAGFTTDYAAAGMVLAPGGTLDFDLTLAAVSAGTLAGDVALSGTGGDLPFVFLVSGQVVAGPPPLTAPLYIDNGDAGYSDTIGFYRRSLSGYLGDYELASGDANGDYAEWTFTNLPEGAFSVAASYWARYNWTDAAQYTVRLFDPATNVTTDFGPYSVNQRVAPDDIYDQGIWWEQLRASLPVPSGATLTVRLTDQGGGSKVVADAIRVEQLTRPEITVLDGGVELTSGSSVVDFGATPAGTPVSRTLTVRNDGGGPLQLPVSITVPGGFTLTAPLGNPLLASGQSTDFTIQLDAGVSGTFSGPISFENSDADESPFLFTIQGSVTLGVPTLTEPIYIDNGDVGYTDTPGFFKRSLAGYQGDYELASGDASGDYAQWEFVGLPGGTFSVATSYWARYNWTDAAQYTVTIAGMQYGPYSVNQREAPDDIYDQGLGWAQLGSVFTVPNGATLTVRLTDEGGGYKVVGDAVRVEQLSPLLGELPASGVTGAEVSVLEAVPTSVVQQAAVLWSAAESQAADRLANVAVIVADLPGQTLGLASAWTQTIWLDADAAGQGWAVIGHQSSVIGREPLVPGHRSPITGFDLLTVIAHELGHVLGLEHADDEHNVMAETLPAGVRRLPPSAAGARFGTAASSAGDALWAAGAEVSVRRVDRDADEASRRADAGLAALLDEPSAAWAPADEQVAQLTAGLRKRSADPKQRLDEALASVGDWLDPLDAILRDL